MLLSIKNRTKPGSFETSYWRRTCAESVKSVEGTPTYSLLSQDDIDNKNFKGVWTTVQSLYDTEENKAQHLEQANHIIYTANLTDKSPVPPRTFIALTQEAHRRIEKITGNSLADITKLQYFFKRVQGCSYWKDTINFIRKDATLKKNWKEATQLLLANIPDERNSRNASNMRAITISEAYLHFVDPESTSSRLSDGVEQKKPSAAERKK